MDKNKIIQAATKFVQKGQFDKAIKEYQKIIEEDSKDIRILQKIGELHQKRGDNVQAAQTFIKVAESYSSDGFFLKSAAVYKQVLKLNPSLVETNFKLAELYQQLGLMSDAVQQYQLVAATYEQQGDAKASLNILKKLTDLDPENVANRIRLAESYSREGLNDEAVAEFGKVAAALKQNNRADEYLKVAERLAFLDPQNMSLCRELANVYLEKGDTKRALAKLQICFKADPRDVETLTLLAQAFKDLGQIAKTLSVYKELAKIYADADRLQDEEGVWQKVLALAPDDPDAQNRSASRGRASPAAVPARVPTGSGLPSRETVPKLLTEMDVYLKYGLHAKAAEHLKKILSLAPDNLIAREKAKDLYLIMGDSRRAADELVNAVRLAMDAGERDRAMAHLEKLQEIAPDHPGLSDLREVIGAPSDVAEVSDDAILVEASEDEVLVAADDDVVEEVSSDELLLDPGAGASDEALYDEDESGEASPGETPSLDEDESLLAPGEESGEDVSLTTGDDIDALDGEPSLDTTSEGEIVDDQALPFDAGVEGGEEAAGREPSSEAGQVEAGVADASTQAYDRDALLSEAFGANRPTVELLGRAPARPPAIIVPPAPPPELEPDTTMPVARPRTDSVVPRSPSKVPPPSAPPSAELSQPDEAEEQEPEELAEAEFFLEQELWDEALEVLELLRQRLGHVSGIRQKLDALETRLAKARAASSEAEIPDQPEQFDLAAELEKEAATAPNDDFQYSVEDVLREFKKGVERTVRPEDVETHYDLGIAYKEMGLVDEAIGEFEMAATGADGKPRQADCLAMIGICLTGKGKLAQAAAVLEKAVNIGGLRSETVTNLHFEIGLAKEGLGDIAGALQAFERVESLDPQYRDVGAALARLRSAKRPNGVSDARDAGDLPGGSGGPGKSRKVGYL